MAATGAQITAGFRATRIFFEKNGREVQDPKASWFLTPWAIKGWMMRFSSHESLRVVEQVLELLVLAFFRGSFCGRSKIGNSYAKKDIEDWQPRRGRPMAQPYDHKPSRIINNLGLLSF